MSRQRYGHFRPMILEVSAAILVVVALMGCGEAAHGDSRGGETGKGTMSRNALDSNSPGSTASSAPRATVHLSKAAYDSEMQRLGKKIGKAVKSLYPMSSGTKGSDAAQQTIAKLERVRTVVSGVLDQVSAIMPPAAVASQHKKLEAGMRELKGEIGKLIASAQSGNVAAFVDESRLSSLEVINNAADAMKAKGYDIVGAR